MSNCFANCEKLIQKYFRNFIVRLPKVFVILPDSLVMTPTIVHNGIIIALNPERHQVRVSLTDADSANCHGCAAAMLCRGKGNVINVSEPHPERFETGQHVRIGVEASSHRRAVGLLLVLPMLALVVPMLLLLTLGMPDWVAFVSGIGLCVLCYVILWWRRRKLNAADIFRIIN